MRAENLFYNCLNYQMEYLDKLGVKLNLASTLVASSYVTTEE